MLLKIVAGWLKTPEEGLNMRWRECEVEIELKESSNKLIKIESAVRRLSERHTDAILFVRDTYIEKSKGCPYNLGLEGRILICTPEATKRCFVALQICYLDRFSVCA